MKALVAGPTAQGRLLRPLAAVAVMVALTACSNHTPTPVTDPSTSLGEDGTDTNQVETQAAALSAALTLGTSGVVSDGGLVVLSPDELLSNAGKTASYFLPSGCITTTTDAATRSATYAMTNCTGVWGLVKVSGTLQTTFTSSTVELDAGAGVDGGAVAALVLDVQNQGDLTFRNATATSYDAKATVWASAALAREMQWSGSLAGTTARGHAFKRTASWNMSWNVSESCIHLDGATNGTVGARSINMTVAGYQRCRGECPSAGQIVITDQTSSSAPESVTITFDGGNVATFTGIDGTTKYDFTLACGL